MPEQGFAVVMTKVSGTRMAPGKPQRQVHAAFAMAVANP